MGLHSGGGGGGGYIRRDIAFHGRGAYIRSFTVYNLTTVCIWLLYHVEHNGICIEHSFKSSDIFKGVGATF